MPILIKKSEKDSFTLEVSGYSNEESLEMLLAENPDILRPESGAQLALVGRQVDLREAGILDLLFVNADGLPIAVEVKLAANNQSRREVVAQAIDYLSALTTLTNEELDLIVQGGLDRALRSFNESEAMDEFERRWQAVGANLRAGLARLVVALDDAPVSLERMVRFLAQNSELDIQLIEVERYAASEIGEVVVPRFVVSTDSIQQQRTPTNRKEPKTELLKIVQAYNSTAPSDMQAVGVASYYRQIRVPDWPSYFRTHYEFYQTNSYVAAELHIESDQARPLAETLSGYSGRNVDDAATISWDSTWSNKKGRLTIRFTPSTDPRTVAQAMHGLIKITREQVTQKMKELSQVIQPS